jgi:hypothetical protein
MAVRDAYTKLSDYAKIARFDLFRSGPRSG